MIFFFLIDAAAIGAFCLAISLVIVTGVLGVLRLSDRDWRDGILLLISGMSLGGSLCCLPHLGHYVMYGIQSKVILLTRIGDGTALLALLISLTIHGRAKWSGLAASVIVLGLIELRIPFG
jgi:hypothetical protein